jgi:aspartyl-tRNA(Asn)/glutamyl-tRNA(Gln) amidotransferase subunit A
MGRATGRCLGDSEHLISVERGDVSGAPSSVAHAGVLLRSGEVTCVSLVEQALAKAEIADTQLKAFITLTPDKAVSAAAVLDAELRNGLDRGPLHGIPIVHKDLFDTASIRTTMGSRFFNERRPTLDADVVRSLKSAGAVSLGKTNMSECAAGLSGLNPFYGDVRNGYDETRLSGGSSGGTAAAIASGVCLVGTATDTGGSIRAPAAYNGIVGLRPTIDLIGLRGVFARAQTLDVAGPMGRSVADVAALLEGMLGRPGLDYLSVIDDDVNRVRVGIIPEWSDHCEERQVQDCFSHALETTKEVDVVEVPFDMRLDEVVDASLCILYYEFARNIRRTHGFREDLFCSGVQHDLKQGDCISTEAYCKALEFKKGFAADFKYVLAQIDFVAAPTVPATAPILGSGAASFESARRCLLPASLAGLPAISIPCGTDAAGLPVGLQFIAAPLSEARLLQVAAAVERGVD